MGGGVGWGHPFLLDCNTICTSVLKRGREKKWKRGKRAIKQDTAEMEEGRDYHNRWYKWFYCWIGALWYTYAAVALSLPLLSQHVHSPSRTLETHTRTRTSATHACKHTHTHTALHWSFWASPYAASAKAPAVHHSQLPWQQSCTQTACRLAVWPWMRAHSHSHTSHTPTQHLHTTHHCKHILKDH